MSDGLLYKIKTLEQRNAQLQDIVWELRTQLRRADAQLRVGATQVQFLNFVDRDAGIMHGQSPVMHLERVPTVGERIAFTDDPEEGGRTDVQGAVVEAHHYINLTTLSHEVELYVRIDEG